MQSQMSLPVAWLNQSDTANVTSGAGTAYPSKAPGFTPGFQWGSCYSIFSFMCKVLQIAVCPFGHCVVRSSSIYGFGLPNWYLQTLLKDSCQFCIDLLSFVDIMLNKKKVMKLHIPVVKQSYWSMLTFVFLMPSCRVCRLFYF